nr:immunoglobulin heavy chain junction region [Mus musculus]MBK4195234.1 immunoglobulin heavy chain junction region [Mus musculus]
CARLDYDYDGGFAYW